VWNRVVGAVGVVLILVACGGGATTSNAPTSARPSQTTGAGSAATPVAIEPGEPIDAAAIATAKDALEAHDSWQFEVSYIQTGYDAPATISGTERRSPEVAVDATHHQTDGSDFRYIRIGDEIWYDAGTSEFTKVDAANAKNLIDQYEPYYLEGLADSAQQQGFEFNPIDTEVLNGISTTHYQLDEFYRERAVQLYDDITADQWAGDAWIANDGGYLVRLTWGPQTPETAQITIGFDYVVTAVDCDCPIEPPPTS
jgi:hypothetical protein